MGRIIKKNDFIEIIKMSIFLIIMATLYSLYKFNFDFKKVSLLVTLKWFPLVFILLLFCFYLGRSMKGKRHE